MRPSKPALPEWARPQDLAPTVENARRLGLPQAARPEAQHGSPAPSTAQQPAEPSWGQRLNRNMRQWGEGVIDRLDEAAVADGGGLVTALAALARTPARSFASFMQGTAGTVSLLDGRVRGEISDGLSQVMSDPGLIGRAASDYWRSRTLADMAADLYANGAAGAMMGGAGAAALGRLNRMPGLGRDVGADVAALYRGIRNPFRQERTSPGNIGNDVPISGGHGPRSSAYGDPERMVHGVASGREFDPTQAGGPVRNLSTEGVRITNRGIDVVERHVSRFQPDEANNFMIERLRRIAQGSLEPTEWDLNYYTHELREYVRYRRLGWESGIPKDPMEAHRLWNNAHTATLEDYRLNGDMLYYPEVIHAKAW